MQLRLAFGVLLLGAAMADVWATPDAAPPSVMKEFNPHSIVFGGRSTLTVTFTNSQVNPAKLSADFVDTFPSNLVVASPANATSNCAGWDKTHR